jgi:hypothetical protein
MIQLPFGLFEPYCQFFDFAPNTFWPNLCLTKQYHRFVILIVKKTLIRIFPELKATGYFFYRYLLKQKHLLP